MVIHRHPCRERPFTCHREPGAQPEVEGRIIPPQGETPGAEVEARVAEQELRRTQDEQSILGPGGVEVLELFRIFLVNANGVEEQLKVPPAGGLPVPV